MPGYDAAAVRDFLERARLVFEGVEHGLNASDIRAQVFPRVSKGGLATKAVDEALWRLEEAFADKERLAKIELMGEEAYYQEVRARAQEILDRVALPPKEKFRTVSFLRPGYHPDDVDEVCEKIVRYFQQEQKLSVSRVRISSFRTMLGGYDEAQVDAVLDETVSVMLAVR